MSIDKKGELIHAEPSAQKSDKTIWEIVMQTYEYKGINPNIPPCTSMDIIFLIVKVLLSKMFKIEEHN